MHTIQSIQNQQNTIIAAVTPLLPLLQAVAAADRQHRCIHPTSVDTASDHRSSEPAKSSRSPSVFTVSSTQNSSPSSKKRNRSSSDGRFSSSPSVALAHVRKKSRIVTSLPTAPETVKQPTPTPPRQSPITINLESGGKQAAQTPRRPLQDLYFQSPGKMVTPKQSHPMPPHQLAPHSAHRPSSSSKAAGGDNRVDKIIRELSLQQPKAGVNPQTNGHTAQTPRGPVIRPPPPFTPQHGRPPTNPAPYPSVGRAGKAAVNPAQAGTIQREFIVPAITGQAQSAGPLPQRSTQAPPKPPFKIPASSTFHTRSVIKEGKRFIPLIDTDDEDEE